MPKRPGESLEYPASKSHRSEKRLGLNNGKSSPRPVSEGPSVSSDLVLPSTLPFKRSQIEERYPKGQNRGRHWKHLKQILQAENYHLLPADQPTYVSIDAPPSMYPTKKYCDISGFEAPYTDPRTKLRYTNSEVFARLRSLPDDYVQGFLSLRSAQAVLK